jgi:hypothetical protein
MSVVQKQVTLKLFFNLSNRTFYVQIGETCYPVRDTVVTLIQEREGLDIRHVADIKEMQIMSLEDDKPENNSL